VVKHKPVAKFLGFRKPPHSCAEVSSPTLQFFHECATSTMSISHPDIPFHMMSFQAFPHISAVATNTGMSTRLMKLSIPFKSVTSVVYVSVCDGALLKLNWCHHRTSSNITFSAGMSLALDQSGGMTLCVRLESCLLSCSNKGIGSHNCAHSEDLAIYCSGSRYSSPDCSFISTSKFTSSLVGRLLPDHDNRIVMFFLYIDML